MGRVYCPLFSSSLSAQPAGLKENLKNYFLHQLEKKSDASLAAFSQKKALKWKEAQKYQTLVWESLKRKLMHSWMRKN